jgi:hypothetical protein
MAQLIASPANWQRAQLEADRSWERRLDPGVVDDLRRALDHALATQRPLLQLGCADFPITARVRDTLQWVVLQTQQRYGLALLRGVPIADLSADESRVLFWGIGMQFGVARPQGKNSQFLSDVRAEGGEYRSPTGRGYNTNASLDFHSDASDLVALLCLKDAKSGGESLVASSFAAHNAMLRERPQLVDILYQPFVYSRQGEQAPEEAPYFEMPIFGERNGQFACRHVRNHITGAQVAFAEVPRLRPDQLEALDRFDATLAREQLCFRMFLEPGDIQFLNNYRVLHSRTAFEDHAQPEQRRHLLRLWLAIPESQPLPSSFQPFYKDVEAGVVRGGHRGQRISAEMEAYEVRLAREHGMPLRVYEDRGLAHALSTEA